MREEDRKTVYISGAITDNPNYEEEFRAAEYRLIEAGYSPINPARKPEGWENRTYKEYLARDIGLLAGADMIYFLPKSRRSIGSTFERIFAGVCEIPELKEIRNDKA